ncbi:PorT family protein [Hymenobacter busanensis]|uniref:PorT family protein n=1 Tax=Hymenobacter busanensis TaxID=2607656 RepID=A0A7L4ZZM9_9BACT|nr:porin family protein [Hymenobacter busanensis]KAA9331579.1 PorT family protein [Hymenobacter busanensis]QHJ08731.1 outer membrane beta-barrel protein [Hymenobacter busanensis]
MKKALLALPLLLAGAITSASAQVEIGLKVSPSISTLRVDSPASLGFTSDGSKLGIGGGLVVDYFFGQNYAFSTGLQLTSKGGKIAYIDQTAPGNANLVTRTQKISLQYVEIPVTVKLFTNDIATDTKLYFQVGGSVNAAVAGRINGSKFYTDPATGSEMKASKHFIIPDAALLGGLGVEYQLGQSTKVFGGLSYHRGLFNIERYFDKERTNMQGVTLKNNEVALDLGLKF